MSCLRSSLANLVFCARHCGVAQLEALCAPLAGQLRAGFIDLDQCWDTVATVVRADERGVLATELEELAVCVVHALLCRGDGAGIGRVESDLDAIASTAGWRAGCAAWIEEAMAPEAVFDACQSVVALHPCNVDGFADVITRHVVGGRNGYADLLGREQPVECRRVLVALLFSMGATHQDWSRWLEWLPSDVRGATSGVMADVLWSLSSDSSFRVGAALPAPPELVTFGWHGRRQLHSQTA